MRDYTLRNAYEHTGSETGIVIESRRGFRYPEICIRGLKLYRTLNSKINQLHSITTEIYEAREENLCGRKQRVVLNGIQSEWKFIPVGVPQGSVLGITDNISSKMKLFPDDSS